MIANRFAALHIATWITASMFFVSAAAAQDRPEARTTTGSAARESPSPPLTVPQAPVGHRQPKASDLPAESQRSAPGTGRPALDRELDKILQICRGC
ncbi:MAG: hypothetical protein K2Y27_08845 [Xanthobacteraceae bacterium]|nr:hypothetical protein [Xanthobacteraceae bacterium]